MIVFAILTVIDFEALRKFEETVAPIITSVGGEMLHAIEVKRNEDATGEEIHVLRFPSLASFEEYKSKTSIDFIEQLRSAAITCIDVKIGLTEKYYSEKNA